MGQLTEQAVQKVKQSTDRLYQSLPQAASVRNCIRKTPHPKGRSKLLRMPLSRLGATEARHHEASPPEIVAPDHSQIVAFVAEDRLRSALPQLPGLGWLLCRGVWLAEKPVKRPERPL